MTDTPETPGTTDTLDTPAVPHTPGVPHTPALPTVALPRRAGVLAGLAAAGLAVMLGSLVAAITEVVSPVVAVGSEFIDHTPRWLKTWAIDTFDTDDKLALRWSIWIVITLLAAGLGAIAVRRRWVGPAGIAAFGIVGAVVAAGRPGEGAGPGAERS